MLINPFDAMELGANIQARKISRESSAYLTSTGLALRRFYQ
jgi:type IV pilus assembly protein PilM